MKVKEVFYIFWLLLFLQAALEVDVCRIEHTFNDEYDIYTASVTVSVPNPVHFVVDLDFCFSCDIPSWNNGGNISETNFDTPYSEKSETFRPPPPNILHSVWLI